MALLGEGKALVDLLTQWRTWREKSNDPARQQAERLIAAFEAYGVRRQQIARLMPESVALPSPLMSSPEKLKSEISPKLLDWAADYLALNRAWFDGVDPQPHLMIEGYKDTPAHERWLRSRIEAAPDLRRHLVVWKAETSQVNFDSVGPLCVVYIEYDTGLDGSELRRYWLLSRSWSLAHPACVECVAALANLARAQGLLVTGRIKPLKWLKRLEDGVVFAPEVDELGGELWHPEEMVFGRGGGPGW